MRLPLLSNSDIVRCDVCGSKKSEPFLVVKKHQYVVCTKCKTIYLVTRNMNLTKKRGNTYLEDVDGYLSIIDPNGTRYMAGHVDYAYEQKLQKPKGKLLEIGSGLGHLSYTLFARDWDVSALELSAQAVTWSSKVFKLPVQATKIEDLKDGTFDAFVMVEVLEHFYNPLQALKQIKRLSAESALVFGTTPNTASKHWTNSEQDIYQPHDHIVLFNKNSLTMLLKKVGLKKITVDYFGTGENNDSNLMFSGVIGK